MTTLKQGPGLMPRNWLADQLRGYGLNQLADRANSPLTGELLYAGGPAGAAVGTLNSLLSGFGYPQPAQPPPADWTRNLRPGDI